MFDLATRQKLRFTTTKGDISVEDLWDLPRNNEKGLSLKSIARTLLVQLKDINAIDEFADDKDEIENEETTILKLKLDIVKFILKVKLDEFENKKNQNQIKAENQRILELIGKKQDQELESLSIDELKAKLK